jgi:hypothetical protein
VAAEVVVSHPETLERLPGRLLDGSVCRRDLVLVKGGAVGVNVDDGVGRRHFDDICLVCFITENPYLWLILTIWKNDNSFLPPGSNDKGPVAFLKKCTFFNDEFRQFG